MGNGDEEGKKQNVIYKTHLTLIRLMAKCADGETISSNMPIDFSWTEVDGAVCYHVEVEDSQGKTVMAAMLQPGVGTYHAPGWLRSKATGGTVRWQVSAFNKDGKQVGKTLWHILRFE